MALTLGSHLTLLDTLEVLPKQVLSSKTHDEAPDTLAVEENAGVLLLLLRCVEEASQHRDQKVLKKPFHEAPPNKLIFSFKVACILVGSTKAHPWDITDSKLVKECDASKGLKTVELYELMDLLVQNFLVLTRSTQEADREHLGDKFSQEVPHLRISGVALLKQLGINTWSSGWRLSKGE